MNYHYVVITLKRGRVARRSGREKGAGRCTIPLCRGRSEMFECHGEQSQ